MPRIHDKHMTVGGMIKALSACKPEEAVYFDFASLRPEGLDSYRGYYEDVAISFTDEPAEGLSAGELLEAFRRKNGHTQEGYKGGTFHVHDNTAVWAANWGRTGSTAVIGVEDTGYGVILHTAYAD